MTPYQLKQMMGGLCLPCPLHSPSGWHAVPRGRFLGPSTPTPLRSAPGRRGLWLSISPPHHPRCAWHLPGWEVGSEAAGTPGAWDQVGAGRLGRSAPRPSAPSTHMRTSGRGAGRVVTAVATHVPLLPAPPTALRTVGSGVRFSVHRSRYVCMRVQVNPQSLPELGGVCW